MPFAASWPVRLADLIVSLSHCIAKSARPPHGVPHVCYCFTPMRYAWHMRDSYFRPAGPLGRMKAAAIDQLLSRIRAWTSGPPRVTHFVAISRTVRDRIRECYNRDSAVIYPPVDTEFYTPAPGPRKTSIWWCRPWLRTSALTWPWQPARLGRKLVVIGSGQEAKNLQALAGPGIAFLGWQSDAAIRDHLRRAKALLFPGEEDFGIVPVEAQACGCPVIAFGRGGAVETVRPLGEVNEPTGVFFDEQTPEALIAAIERFERDADRFDPRAARRQAVLFRKERFEQDLFAYLDRVLAGAAAGNRLPITEAAALCSWVESLVRGDGSVQGTDEFAMSLFSAGKAGPTLVP